MMVRLRYSQHQARVQRSVYYFHRPEHIGVLLLVAVAASGCFRAQAQVPVAMPPLEVPAAPPRLVEPSLPDNPPPGPDLLDEPANRPLPPQTDLDSQPRTDSANPPAPVVPPVDAAAPAPVRTPPTTLKTVSPQEEGRMERAIRALARRAQADLNRVDYQSLGRDARANYDQAKRFIVQAEEALKAKNLVFAETVADKAATLAGQLARR